MDCSVGEYNMNALELEDKMRIHKCEKKETEQEKKETKVTKRRKKGREELWMRKLQSTKLGPSEQFFVIFFFVSGWKCAVFEENLPPKVVSESDTPADFVTRSLCGDWSDTHKVYIFGNCD